MKEQCGLAQLNEYKTSFRQQPEKLASQSGSEEYWSGWTVVLRGWPTEQPASLFVSTLICSELPLAIRTKRWDGISRKFTRYRWWLNKQSITKPHCFSGLCFGQKRQWEIFSFVLNKVFSLKYWCWKRIFCMFPNKIYVRAENSKECDYKFLNQKKFVIKQLNILLPRSIENFFSSYR